MTSSRRTTLRARRSRSRRASARTLRHMTSWSRCRWGRRAPGLVAQARLLLTGRDKAQTRVRGDVGRAGGSQQHRQRHCNACDWPICLPEVAQAGRPAGRPVTLRQPRPHPDPPARPPTAARCCTVPSYCRPQWCGCPGPAAPSWHLRWRRTPGSASRACRRGGAGRGRGTMAQCGQAGRFGVAPTDNDGRGGPERPRSWRGLCAGAPAGACRT